ncbi:MAG: T9SS type A sorting domain-containing protein, partial [Bergeyella zoohelcum]|nr:T9SS type A sorting domain-containing protein [Bergeyella zoohelcum]
AGAEVLKYAVKHQYLERYDVYVVYSQGDLPTADEINDGIKIYTFDGEEQSESFINREFNIKEHTTKDFHIVFHHRTKAEDDGLYLALDDIEIGYDNTIAANAQQANISVETDNKETEKVVFSKDKDKIITTEMMEELGLNNTEKVANSLPTNTIKPLGILNLPTLTGYEIVKDGVSIKTNANVDEKTYKEIFSGNVGTITYDVYALYSDGVKSEKQTVTIDTTPLSASEVAVNDRLKVYPNPSDGRFVIEAKTGVSKLYTEVYDASGKLIFKKEYQGNKADLDLTQYPKGIYLLNVVDNNGQRQTVKLIIK